MSHSRPQPLCPFASSPCARRSDPEPSAGTAFLQKGWHILEGPKLGLPDSVHDGIYETGMDVLSKGRRSFRRGPDGKMIMEQAPDNELIAENVTSRIPAMQEVISSPAVSGALQSLLGEGFALHPHTFLHNTNAGMDQDFHKDGILPWNGHAMRTHQPEYMLMLYYPQDTPEDLGPTEILPCTQYFHNDSTPENGYPTAGRTIGGGVSAEPDFAQRDADRAAVLKQVGWPEETTPKKVIVPKGSVAFTHFDVYHRGTRRNPNRRGRERSRVVLPVCFGAGC